VRLLTRGSSLPTSLREADRASSPPHLRKTRRFRAVTVGRRRARSERTRVKDATVDRTGTHVVTARRAAAGCPFPLKTTNNPMVCGRVDARARHGPFDTASSHGYSSPHPPAPPSTPHRARLHSPTLARVHYAGMRGMRADRRTATAGSSSFPWRPQPCEYASAAVVASENFSAQARQRRAILSSVFNTDFAGIYGIVGPVVERNKKRRKK